MANSKRAIDYFKKLFCFHSNVRREFHVREEDYKKFDKVDIKTVCTNCGYSKYLGRAETSTIHVWSSNPERFKGEIMANSKRKYQSLKITQSAEGQECQVRYPGVCNFNDETTIFAHLNGGGMGTKQPDLIGSYCCSSCHDVYDGKVNASFTDRGIQVYFHDGIFRTQQILLDKGLIII